MDYVFPLRTIEDHHLSLRLDPAGAEGAWKILGLRGPPDAKSLRNPYESWRLAMDLSIKTAKRSRGRCGGGGVSGMSKNLTNSLLFRTPLDSGCGLPDIHICPPLIYALG